MAEIEGLPIFRAGKYHDGTVDITDSDLDDMVNSYDATREAFARPVKVTHQDRDAERSAALGVIKKVYTGVVDGVKHLMADLVDVPDRLKQAIQDRRILDRSIEMYPEFEFGGRKHKNVLRSLAFLGADIPEVKGLPDLRQYVYGENDPEYIVLEFAEASWGKANPNNLPADKRKPEWYAWVPDKEKPSTWKFPYRSRFTGKPHRQGISAAIAALHGARTGANLTIQYPGVLAKLQAAAKSLGMKFGEEGHPASKDVSSPDIDIDSDPHGAGQEKNIVKKEGMNMSDKEKPFRSFADEKEFNEFIRAKIADATRDKVPKTELKKLQVRLEKEERAKHFAELKQRIAKLSEPNEKGYALPSAVLKGFAEELAVLPIGDKILTFGEGDGAKPVLDLILQRFEHLRKTGLVKFSEQAKSGSDDTGKSVEDKTKIKALKAQYRVFAEAGALPDGTTEEAFIKANF